MDSAERARAGYLPDKVRYAPWSGEAMEGEMTLTAGGRDITLTRLTKTKTGPMADSTSYEYNTGTGLHPISTRQFASCFTIGANKDYGSTGVTNQKICTCCGQAYTGASCPNCTNTRCSVCGKCPNHCTCKNTNLVTDDHYAYISGYPDGTFRPTGTLTRAEAAVIFYKLLENKNYISSKYFSDVNHNDWYYTYVSCLASKGIISGYPDGCFHPGWKVTRAEFCVMSRGMLVAVLYSAAGSPNTSGALPFTDVAYSDYYYDAVLWAYRSGIVSGKTATTFAPGANVTREQFAAILYAYAARAGHDMTAGGSLYGYSDVNSISAYARTAMASAPFLLFHPP